MDFTTALSYPYKSLAKVFTIVLVMTIGVAVFLGMILNSFDWIGYIYYLQELAQYGGSSYPFVPRYDTNQAQLIVGILGLFGLAIVQGFWISGYSIRIIRAIIDESQTLPAIVFGVDLAKGFYLFLSSILYAVVFIPFVLVVGFLMAMTAGPYGTSGLSILIYCSAILVAIPFLFVAGWAYFIGMARCAAEDSNSALFQIWTNMRIARENTRASFSLIGYQILLFLVYLFIGQVAGKVFEVVSGAFVTDYINETMLLVIMIISLMLQLAFSIVQQFSNIHLIAQYAQRIGIADSYDDKDKNKNM